jgi:hypothetical protein
MVSKQTTFREASVNRSVTEIQVISTSPHIIKNIGILPTVTEEL